MFEMEKELSYKVTFNKPEYNTTYKFCRRETTAFDYGNKSMVAIYRAGQYFGMCDTRYDKLVIKDFKAWCEEWLKYAFNSDYEPKWEILK